MAANQAPMIYGQDTQLYPRIGDKKVDKRVNNAAEVGQLVSDWQCLVLRLLLGPLLWLIPVKIGNCLLAQIRFYSAFPFSSGIHNNCGQMTRRRRSIQPSLSIPLPMVCPVSFQTEILIANMPHTHSLAGNDFQAQDYTYAKKELEQWAVSPHLRPFLRLFVRFCAPIVDQRF